MAPDLSYYFLGKSQMDDHLKHKRETLRIAHGYGNSREWIRQALRIEPSAIESDLWYKDGQIFLRHERRAPLVPILYDQRPDRRKVDGRFVVPLGPWYIRPDLDPLTLDGMLEEMGNRCGLFLDFKGNYNDATGHEFVKRTLAGLKEYSLPREPIFTGNWLLLNRIKAEAQDSKVYYSLGNLKDWPALLDLVTTGANIDGVSIRAHLLSEERARILKQQNIEIVCWTVNDPGEATRLIDLGADGIVSDDLMLLDSLTADCATSKDPIQETP